MNDRVFVIAEAGVNHNGDFDLARRLIDIAAEAGADAVKFQSFRAEALASKDAGKVAYQKNTTDPGESQLGMLKKLELAERWHEPLMQHAKASGIEFMSSPFDFDSLELLIELKVQRLKVPSGELINAPLLWRMGSSGLPVILSTGMATMAEVETGLAVLAHGASNSSEPKSMMDVRESWKNPDIRSQLQDRVTVLHCTSRYPTPANRANLNAMDTLRDRFDLPVGYSDHTEGILVPIAAVAKGATAIEKHFTTDRALPGPDHKASLEPSELKEMVQMIRQVESMLGDGLKAPQPEEEEIREVARQRVVAARSIKAGQTISREDLTTARSVKGRFASELWDTIGTTAATDFALGEAIE